MALPLLRNAVSDAQSTSNVLQKRWLLLIFLYCCMPPVRSETSSRYGSRACWEEEAKLLWCITVAGTDAGRRLCWLVQWGRHECLYRIGILSREASFVHGPNARALTLIQKCNEMQSSKDLSSLQLPCIQRQTLRLGLTLAETAHSLSLKYLVCQSVIGERYSSCSGKNVPQAGMSS